MPFWRSFAHLVWTTRNREPLIRAELEAALYACLVAKAAEMGCYVQAINGVADHVHLVLSIPPRYSVSDVVKNLKGSSSHFVNHELSPGQPPFAWQRGYGYLSLGESQCARAVAYVENQKEHHRQHTTNGWLERVADEDRADDSPAGKTPLREERAVYRTDLDAPF